ncbi:MAG: SDR family NAD(P)-dependent oxidoreductase [Halorhodospira sp.]
MADDLPRNAGPRGALGVVLAGGSRGLGLAMAQRFLTAGDAVVLCGRDASRLEVACADLAARTDAGERLHALACDVARPEEAARLGDFAVQRLGTIHRWINNAGTAGHHKRPLAELAASDIATTCATNLTGSMQLCAEAVRRMGDQPAATKPHYHLFNFGFSGFGARFSRTSIPHRVSKLAVAELSRQLRHELQKLGQRSIGVHELRPGLVRTELLLADLPAGAQPIVERMAEPPERVAEALVPRIRGITGTGRVIQRHSKPLMLLRGVAAVAGG